MLTFVGVADLFKVRHINRSLRMLVDGSDVLRRKMHIDPDWTGQFTTAFPRGSECARQTGLSCEVVFSGNTAILGVEQKPGTYAIAVEVQLDARRSMKPLPPIDFSCRDMYLCQPPPTEVNVYPDCCSKYNYSSLRGCGTYLLSLMDIIANQSCPTGRPYSKPVVVLSVC